jgi:hypothetical protein
MCQHAFVLKAACVVKPQPSCVRRITFLAIEDHPSFAFLRD